ncbi:MAG: DUF1700 domain-containing protein [Eubacteriales bacterium]|nr:DUF1700 domain-containing protein [Eubacteriales bacterium]
MRKNEFLSRLKEALENDLDSKAVQENVTYYTSYINEEIAKGRSESEVIEELGDPWVLARSVIDMAESQGETTNNSNQNSYNYGYGNADRNESSQQNSSNNGGNIHVFSADSWWKKLLFVVGIIGIVFLVVSVIGGVLSILSPILMPVIIVIVLMRFFRRIR